MEQELTTDICVIGGGPAGATLSLRLREAGHQVMLVEKEIFPRPHPGICLSSDTDALLEYLGLAKKIKQESFFQRNTTLVKWAADNAEAKAQMGSHVDRGRFDQVLLQQAADAGVQIIQPARTLSVNHVQTGEWKIKISFIGKPVTIHARFLADASGRTAALPGKRIRKAPSLFALHAIWKLRSIPRYDGLMEAEKNGWMWAALLHDHRCMISVYTDPAYLSHNGEGELQQYYLSALKNFSVLKLFDLDELQSHVSGCDASSRYSTDPVAADYIRLGDACFAVDPMASQGVHLALSAAIQAAIVVHTLLHYPEHAAAARQFYIDRLQERITMYHERTAIEYTRAAVRLPYPFWQERSISAYTEASPQHVNQYQLTTGQKLRVCPLTKIISTPVMKEHWIEYGQALHHPALHRPVAYLAGKNLDELFPYLNKEQTVSGILHSWKELVPEDTGLQIIQWLWENGILVPVGD